MIPKETVDEILETSRVEDVVGEYVTLKKRGVNLLGLCPFHNEKTPSFTVSPTKGIYKCFGCGKGGSAVNFLMDHEHYSYPEALKFLANKYNIELEEEELTAEEVQQMNEKESLFIVTQFAAEYFQNQLHQSEEGKAIGLSYFKERGFRQDTIEKFKLGYHPDAWDTFTKTALKKGYNIDFLEKTGLTIVKEDKHFDRFKGRVIFPIQNISGRVIGFGGRTLLADKKIAKYLNSPESDIYHKSKVLYGLNHAKKSIIENDNCFLVEGYTDVISMSQNGVENVVSSSGTSLTVDQIKLIKRYTSNITILFDGDEAGIKAAFRGIDLILTEGLNVKIVSFPESTDPDSFAQSHSNQELIDFLNEAAVDFIRYKTQLLLAAVGDDPIKRAKLIKEIVGSIALIPDPISRSVYLQECSQLMEIDEQSLLSELNKVRRKNISDKAIEVERDHKKEDRGFDPPQVKDFGEKHLNVNDFQEEDLIRTFIKYGSKTIHLPSQSEEEEEKEELTVADFLINEIEADELTFSHPVFSKIYEIYKKSFEEGIQVVENDLVSNKDQQISSLAIEFLLERYSLSLNWEEKHKILTVKEVDILPKKVHKGICSWRLAKVQELIEQNQDLLKDESVDYASIYSVILRLQEAKKALANELGRIILK
ncbi:MAG: DNA primase [Verrucomicrobia bacterium]|nr:DNA primase [Verrucomicrobiota bacterium]